MPSESSASPDPNDIRTTNAVAVVETHGFWEWFQDHWVGLLWIPLGIAFAVGLILGYNWLTGRSPVDELPVGVAGNFVIVLSAAATSIYFYRATFPRIDTTKAGVPWWQVVCIYAIKLFLLWFFWYAYTHG